jgi:hypothetical protein
MISLEMAMKPLHGGDTCPFSWDPYTSSSTGSVLQCNVVIGIGISTLIVCFFLCAFEVAMLRGDGVLIRLTPVLGQLSVVTVTLICVLGMGAMCASEFEKLCNSFMHDSPTVTHYSNCEQAIQGYGNDPRFSDEGVASLYTHLEDVSNAAWATVIL